MPSPSKEEQLYASLQRGMQATAELTVVAQVLEARKHELIQNAITAYNSRVPEHKMTERDAMLFVAALAENQRLLDDLGAVESAGRRASKQLQFQS